MRVQREPFVMIPVWLAREASGRALRIYVLLSMEGDNEAERPPNQSLHTVLAEMGGVSKETIYRGLKELNFLGAITITKKHSGKVGRPATHYTIHTEKQER